MTTAPSNKAKIARRVIEVLQFFDDRHPEATVMDIVRRYNRPQSSTSELLSSLVELGILHKDPYTRSYRLTARAALLGSSGQPALVRDGRLARLMDRLLSQTGLPVALFGMVGLDSQITSIRPGSRVQPSRDYDLFSGMKDALSRTAAGWLLLSTLPKTRREGVVRRLNAEAPDEFKFNHSELMDRVARCGARQNVFGPAGYGTNGEMVGALIPALPKDDPLVVGVIHAPDDKANPEVLLQCIGDAMRACLSDRGTSNVEDLPNAA